MRIMKMLDKLLISVGIVELIAATMASARHGMILSALLLEVVTISVAVVAAAYYS